MAASACRAAGRERGALTSGHLLRLRRVRDGIGAALVTQGRCGGCAGWLGRGPNLAGQQHWPAPPWPGAMAVQASALPEQTAIPRTMHPGVTPYLSSPAGSPQP